MHPAVIVGTVVTTAVAGGVAREVHKRRKAKLEAAAKRKGWRVRFWKKR